MSRIDDQVSQKLDIYDTIKDAEDIDGYEDGCDQYAVVLNNVMFSWYWAKDVGEAWDKFVTEFNLPPKSDDVVWITSLTELLKR